MNPKDRLITREDDNFDRDHLLRLSAKCCDESLTDPELTQLEWMLRRSQGARELYRAYTSVHVTLGNCFGAVTQKVTPGKIAPMPAESGRSVWVRRAGLAAAALVAIGVATVALLRGGGDAGSEVVVSIPEAAPSALQTSPALEAAPVAPVVAKAVPVVKAVSKSVPSEPAPAAGDLVIVKSLSNVKWAQKTKPLRKNTWIGNATVALESGLVRLRFRKGAVVTMRGPARLKILSGNSAQLLYGEVVSLVPDRAIGFTLQTASMDVVDLGTEFGVQAGKDGDVEVEVYRGEVELVSPEGAPGAIGSPRKLRAGQAMRGRPGGQRDGAGPVRTALEPVAEPSFSLRRLAAFNAGVAKTTGPVRFLSEELERPLKDYESNKQLLLIPERSGVVLEAPLEVTFDAPGTYIGSQWPPVSLPAGSRVRSYLLNFNPMGGGPYRKGAGQSFKGAVTFEGEVVAIVAMQSQLAETDAIFAQNPDRYRNFTGRAIDPGMLEALDRGKKTGPADMVTLSGNRRTVRVDWRASSAADSVRVLVLDPEA